MEPRAKAGEHRNLMDDPLAVVKRRTQRWIGCGSKAYPLPISRVHYVVSNLRLSTSVSVWLSDYSDRWMIPGLGQVFSSVPLKGFIVCSQDGPRRKGLHLSEGQSNGQLFGRFSVAQSCAKGVSN